MSVGGLEAECLCPVSAITCRGQLRPLHLQLQPQLQIVTVIVSAAVAPGHQAAVMERGGEVARQ